MLIDLRSDTVTLPTREMLEAITSAPLGDDVMGEDPTVRALEQESAEIVGKEAALLFPTGTGANLCALLTHAARGTRVVCGEQSHVYQYEAGGASALGGLAYHPVPNTADGGLSAGPLAEILSVHARAADDLHLAPVGVLAFEVTHNRCGGVIPELAVCGDQATQARALAIPVHLDGARLFNAAVVLQRPAREVAAFADSVQFCFSKGLAAPMGSVLAGTTPFIQRARRLRKMLGGGMRQAGVMAAPARVALRTQVGRLAEDHLHAAQLAEGLRMAGAGTLEVQAPQTNIVFFRPRGAPGESSSALVAALREQNVFVASMGPWIRAVTHLGIRATDVAEVVRRLPAALGRAQEAAARP